MPVPSPGESISEVEIAQWLVKDGDYVEKDQTIAEVDSDKATLDLPAEESESKKSRAQRGPGIGRGPPLQYAAQVRGMRQGRRIPLNFCFCNSCGNCSIPDFPGIKF